MSRIRQLFLFVTPLLAACAASSPSTPISINSSSYVQDGRIITPRPNAPGENQVKARKPSPHSTPEEAGAKPKQYVAAVKAHLNHYLKDPYSVRSLGIKPPVMARCDPGVGEPFWGWRVDVQYNAKNSWGAYVGTREQYYWFLGEKLWGMTDLATKCDRAVVWRFGVEL